MNRPQDFVWVPEDCVFDSSAECIGEHPDPPACMFPTPVAYAALKAELEHWKNESDIRKNAYE